tara:strand:+ start:128 stop:1000 length:873 start_codon:yes stop_codon:yes gene_type:complete
MQNIVGLGGAGCGVAKSFSRYPEYTVRTIDCVEPSGEEHFRIKKCESHEEYEKAVPDMSKFFSHIKGMDEVLFIIGGSGAISGASLAILQQISHAKLHVLYIKPDISLLSEMGQLRERLVYNVLQEYARSGKFERIILIDNPKLDETIGGAPIIGYYDELNKMIASTIHMVNVFDHSDPEIGTISNPLEVSRIITIGMMDVENGEEKLFFPLTNPREKSYYYAINHEELKNDKELYKGITVQMKSKVEEDATRVTYGIYSTNYNSNYCYVVARSSMIQGLVLEENNAENN